MPAQIHEKVRNVGINSIFAFITVAGLGLFSTLSGLVAAWFLSPGQVEADNNMQKLEDQINNIRKYIEQKKDTSNQ